MFHKVFHNVHNAAFDKLRLRRYVGSAGQNDTLNGEIIKVSLLVSRFSLLKKNTSSLRQAQAPANYTWFGWENDTLSGERYEV
ncbi:hypothetical protein CHX27_05575 [Flavobacterium aurantiibacter]|uniref:Uncharacterized protein n=1 Tax=Flavobacterium aurantiibacter TaxID=2023067 RepID=A0A255ZVX7_9FLAO|nr:hypothetical protein CHX27_05575 [Flavobacterium aurantiibacter]